MSKSVKTTLEQKLINARLVCKGVQKEPFKTALVKYGYDEIRLAEGLTLLDEARALTEAQKSAYKEQLQASSDFQNGSKDADDYYTEQTILARKALVDDPDSFNLLGLSGKKKVSFEGWTGDARSFYTNALESPVILAALAKFSVTEDILNTGLTLINDLELLQEVHKEKTGHAQVTTPARNAKIDQLERWKSEVITCARLAFKDDLQQLEKLGITVYTPGYTPKNANDDEPADPVEPPIEQPVEPPVT
jgi:hypothetical protein